MAITVEAFTFNASVTNAEKSIRDGGGLGADTTDGVFQAFVDLNALVAGDVFEFRVYEKAYAAQTQRLVYSARFANVQAQPMWVSPAMCLGTGWDMVLIRIAGSDRTIVARISQIS